MQRFSGKKQKRSLSNMGIPEGESCVEITRRRLQFVARMLIISILLSIVSAGLSRPAPADNTYLIQDGSKQIVHVTKTTEPAEILEEAGIVLGEEDYMESPREENGRKVLELKRAGHVTLICDGKSTRVTTYGETVDELLSKAGIKLGEEDRTTLPGDTATEDGMSVTVLRTTHKTVEYDEVIPFETARYTDNTLAAGEIKILCAGQDGKVHRTAYVTYENGAEVSREIITEKTMLQPIKETVLYGPELPKVSAVQTAAAEESIVPEEEKPQGTVRVLSCLGTAYSCDGRPGRTATGTTVHLGTIAVDPKVIPLGSKLYITSADGKFVYGYGTAEDTGGLIKGNRVDLYYNTTGECVQFGARNVVVYVFPKN